MIVNLLVVRDITRELIAFAREHAKKTRISADEVQQIFEELSKYADAAGLLQRRLVLEKIKTVIANDIEAWLTRSEDPPLTYSGWQVADALSRCDIFKYTEEDPAYTETVYATFARGEWKPSEDRED